VLNKAIETELLQGLARLELTLSAVQIQQLLDYLILLTKWNKAYNLTAVRDPLQMVTRHLLDSLIILPYLGGQRIIDIGTGAGLPGIPLAIADPQRSYCLLDSNGKKIRFLQQTVLQLGLKNVTTVEDRAENYTAEHSYDSIVARAVASVAEIMSNTQHLLCPTGQWLLMKGQYPQEELEAIKAEFSVIPYQVPGLDEQRHLVCVQKSGL
jgi:16S rRNA (guanine527-N7)-methyltransferase